MNENKLPAFDSTDDLIEFFDSTNLSDFDLPEVELEVDIQTREFMEDEDGRFDQTTKKNNLQ